MPHRSSHPLHREAAVVLVGLLVPTIVAAVALDFLAMYLDGAAFTYVVAALFALAAWYCIERWSLDRVNVVVAAVLVPAVFFFVVPLVIVLAGDSVRTLVRFLVSDFEGLFRYLVSFSLAGILAAGVSREVGAAAERDGRVPEPTKVVQLVAAVLLVSAILFAGVNHVTASAATISTVGPDAGLRGDQGLNVTVTDSTADLRITAVAPDGTRVTKRLPRTGPGNVTRYVRYELQFDETPPAERLPVLAGTYRVTVKTLLGVPVETETYTVDSVSKPTFARAAVVSGAVEWTEKPEHVIRSFPEAETKVVVVLASDASLSYPVELTVETPAGERVDLHYSRELTIPPGERTALVLSIPPDVAGEIRAEHNGVVNIVLEYPDGTSETVTRSLPEEQSSLSLPEP